MWSCEEGVGNVAEAHELLAQVASDEWGHVAVSLYDTARLVALSPWLPGHRERLEFLYRRQRFDGGWGGPDGYAVVPTLSATIAMMAQLSREKPGRERERLVRAAKDGLHVLRHWLDPQTGLAIPDTIGVELIIPALVEELNELLRQTDQLGSQLPLPQGFGRRQLEGMRARFDAGGLPQRSWACLEVFGKAAIGAPFVRPVGGAVGCSAAATAAWLGGPDGYQPGVHFLEALQAKGGGPVPGVTPITYFERAWVLNSLAIGGIAYTAPVEILDRLEAGLTPHGAPAAGGLPPDADDTAAVLAALLRHGRVHAPESLLGYEVDGRFACFLDERNPSVSTNAHALEALALYMAYRPNDSTRFADLAATTARWLLDRQEPEGNWWDKWHASAYYATACCVIALVLNGSAESCASVDRAVDWVLQTQRADGSWGRWQGTVEETSYAVQILAIATSGELTERAASAINRGCAFLADPPPVAEHPPLWHAKDLYLPVAVVRAARLAALHMGGLNDVGAKASAATLADADWLSPEVA